MRLRLRRSPRLPRSTLHKRLPMEGRADHDTPTILSSSDTPPIKLVRSLRQRKTREAERLFLVEGQLLIEDLFAVGVRPELVLIRENEAQRAIELSKLAKEPFDFKLVDRKLFDSLSDAVTPQGILAIVRFPELSM